MLVTEVEFFGQFATNSLKFPIFLFLVGLHDFSPNLLLAVIDISSQPPLFFQKYVETEEFSLPISLSLGRALSWLHRFPQGNKIIITDFSTTVLISNVDEKFTTVLCEVTSS
jgi:hypothetical protein